jgi:excisionase family DNA binding protein
MNASSEQIHPGGFKLKQAAKYLSISPITLRRLVDRGLIRPNRQLRHLLFFRAELDRFLSQQ